MGCVCGLTSGRRTGDGDVCESGESLCYNTKTPRRTLRRQHQLLLTFTCCCRRGEGDKQWHIRPNVAPPPAAPRRLHYSTCHCPAPSRQSLFRCANSAPWKDYKNKSRTSKAAEKDLCLLLSGQQGMHKHRRKEGLVRKELQKVAASSHERPKPRKVPYPTRPTVAQPPTALGWMTAKVH